MEWSSPWGCSLHTKQLAMEWSSPCPFCWIRCQVELPYRANQPIHPT
jgi:hypothetical protein